MPEALQEWHALDGSVKNLFFKELKITLNYKIQIKGTFLFNIILTGF